MFYILKRTQLFLEQVGYNSIYGSCPYFTSASVESPQIPPMISKVQINPMPRNIFKYIKILEKCVAIVVALALYCKF